MGNPSPDLQGFADPEIPGWEDRAINAVRARQLKSNRSKERKNGMYLFFDDGFRVMLDEASHRRDISMSGYGRRSIAAFLAHDLGIPIEEVLKFTAKPAPYRVGGGGILVKSFDDGEGQGLWVIGNLER